MGQGKARIEEAEATVADMQSRAFAHRSEITKIEDYGCQNTNVSGFEIRILLSRGIVLHNVCNFSPGTQESIRPEEGLSDISKPLSDIGHVLQIFE